MVARPCALELRVEWMRIEIESVVRGLLCLLAFISASIAPLMTVTIVVHICCTPTSMVEQSLMLSVTSYILLRMFHCSLKLAKSVSSSDSSLCFSHEPGYLVISSLWAGVTENVAMFDRNLEKVELTKA